MNVGLLVLFLQKKKTDLTKATIFTSEKFSKSFLGALKGRGKRREAENRGSSKLHTVFTPVQDMPTFFGQTSVI